MWFVTTKGVTHPGIAPGRFMTKSFDEGSGAAISATAAYIRKRIDKYNVAQAQARESLGAA